MLEIEPIVDPLPVLLDRVVAACGRIRAPLADSEYRIHDAVREALTWHGLRFEHEVKLGPRARIDFMVEGLVGIEIKKGKVGSAEMLAQAERYCAFEQVAGLVLVVERCVFAAPMKLAKPVRYVSLSKNWGVAL